MKIKVFLFAFVFALSYSIESNAETIKLGLDVIPASLDPHVQLSESTLRLSHLVFDPLILITNGGWVVPRLATSWERIDDLTMRFFLRKGVKFHSGNTFSAKDVKFTLKRLKKSVYFKGLFEMFTEAVVIDDYTVDIKTKKPYGLLLRMCTYIFSMDSIYYSGTDSYGQPKDAIVKFGPSFALKNESGTGPYSVSDHEEGVRLVMDRFADYWDKTLPSNVNRIILTPIREDATRVAALLSGDVDIISPVPIQDINRIERDPEVNLFTYPSGRIIMLQLNQKRRPEFRSRKVRQAIVHAIDNKEIVEKIMKGAAATPAAQFSPKGYTGHVPSLNPRYDLRKAKGLMNEAGFADGFECTMIAPNNRYVNDEKIADAVVGMLAKINIKVNLKTMPKAQYWDEFDAQVADIQMIGWYSDTEDSGNFTEFLAMCPDKETGYGQYNSGNYCNKEVDKLTLTAQSETDLTRQAAILQKVEKILYDDAAFVPLYWQNDMFAYNKGKFKQPPIDIMCVTKTGFRTICGQNECPDPCTKAKIKCDKVNCCRKYN